jgi:hypothetical protein
MVNEVLTGKEKMGTAVVKMMGQIEMQMIDQGISMIVKKYATQLLQLVVDHSTVLAQILGIQATGNAAQKVQDTQAAVSTIGAKAAEAGAGAIAAAMVAVPFPEDLTVAPAAGATAVSEVISMLSLLAFEKGGVVPQTGLAVLHAREMVLPAPIAMGLETAIAAPAHAVSFPGPPELAGAPGAGIGIAGLPALGMGKGVAPNIGSNPLFDRGGSGNFDGSSKRTSNVTNNTSNLKVELHGHGMNPEDIFGMEDKLVSAIQRATRRGKLPS